MQLANEMTAAENHEGAKSGTQNRNRVRIRPRGVRMNCRRIASLLVVLFCTACALGQSGVGKVDFANSGAAAQPSFQRGLAQLHNFQYPQAEKLFEQAEAADANFAMAYWGEALTHVHPLWNYEDLEGARAVLKKLAATPELRAAKAGTQREKEYLHSLEVLFGDGDRDTRNKRYADELGKLHDRYPDDVDAAALYALALMGSCGTKRDDTVYIRAAAVLEDYFSKYPDHPGVVHYLIHSTDDPMHAALGLRAAQRYGTIAPESAHAQHMTSHIFIALGMWPDVVKANLAALAAGQRHGAAEAPASHGSPECNHPNSWLSYAYLQQRREQDAHDVIRSCMLQTRATGSEDAYSYGERMIASYVFETKQWNNDLLSLPAPPRDASDPQVMYHYVRAVAAIGRNDPGDAQAELEQLKAARAAFDEVLAKEVHPNLSYSHAALVEQRQVEALLLAANGKKDEAVRALRETAAMEHGIPFEFGPPLIPLQTNEALAELLMQMGRPGEAAQLLKDQLRITPGKTRVLMALRDAAKQTGDTETASDIERQITHNLSGSTGAAR